jgi:hypothetical protein
MIFTQSAVKFTGFSLEKQETIYMKKLVIAANIAAFVHTCMTGDATALVVAFAWFAVEYGKSLYKMWYKLLYK